MPHIVLEYSENLPELADFPGLFSDVHQALNRIGGIRIENCKSRVLVARHCFVGAGDASSSFIHLQISFVSGRTAEVRRALGEACLELLKSHYRQQLSEDLQITVLIGEIALQDYFKYPEGTLNYR